MKKSQERITLKTLYQRANQAAGQLLKIEKMVRAKRPPEQILNMLLAIEGSVESLIYKHFSSIIRKHLTTVIAELSDAENVAPALENLIDTIRKKRPPYLLVELPKVFYDLKQFRHPVYC